ncbi:NAD(P)-dependent alcohol dehydrogenase [uncultured Demequina sp.]|uniref:NAD(P)-dependent alcohol dehydrogenase n=1 Tax=uncultured Demequina sp. TaxID=693499 RepID=UPI0025EAE2F6|nr:NAD(P)-dependent alcohol dehydrogenase [uncultured Demequina sp.]
MKATTYDRYGGPDVLAVSDIPEPVPEPDQVLIDVDSASLNAWDWHQLRGEPRFMRLQTGLRVREPRTLGADLAGTVAAVGTEVSGVVTGDRVLALVGHGALAERAVARGGAMARISDDVPFDVAAATPMAGLTALQALRDSGRLAPGERVLVWGASGGVGHLAVQIAKVLGASRVDAVASGRNAEMLTRLGADAVADYTKDESPEGPYDLIVDTVATASMRTLRGLLKDGGRVVTIGSVAGTGLLGPAAALLRRVIAAAFLRMRHSGAIAKVAHGDLDQLSTWLTDGRIAPVVRNAGSLEDVAGAVRELEDGHVAGKLSIAVAPGAVRTSTRSGAASAAD